MDEREQVTVRQGNNLMNFEVGILDDLDPSFRGEEQKYCVGFKRNRTVKNGKWNGDVGKGGCSKR